MKTKFFGKVNYIGWVVIILAFLFIYFTYFFVYIPKQKSDLTQRAFRILKEYGNNMVGKHGYYVTHFKNYGIYYSIKRFNESKLFEVKNADNEDYKKINSVVLNLFPYVLTDNVKKSGDSAFFYSKKENKLLLNFYFQTPDTASLHKITGVYKIDEQVYKGQKSLETLLRDSAINQVPIDKFMEGLQFDELFENIILFDNSMVYYNSNHDNLVDITNPGSLDDTTKNTQGGIYKALNIRGKDKHIMILPIDFDGKRFYIAGLITDTNFKSITQTFNSRVLILIAAILLLVFVGMPVLKTFFIGPKERLHSMDVAGSTISILFGSALFVLIIIGLLKNQLVDRSELSNRIETISDSLYSYVSQDISSIKSLGNSILQKENSKSLLADSVINIFNSDTSFFRNKSLKSPFPLNEIILIDSAGLVKKGYTRTAFSDAVDVNLSDRQYFRNAIDTNLAWPTSPNAHFYIESIQSYNTGEGETAISFYNSNFKNTAVLAITSKIPSLYQQVLPKDIEFVVIDKTGKVLYHSIQSKNLHENFIEECESDPGILSAIQLRLKDKIQIKYNEKKWLARIVPIEDTPLFHITLLDLNQTENKNARIFLMTFYFMIGLQFVTILSIFLLRITFKSNNNEPRVFRFLKWLAFMPSNYNVYKGLSVILGLIAAAGISSFIIQADLVNVLLLQFLSIGFTFYASLLFLKRKEITLNEYFKGKYFPENIILAFIGIMIFVCIWKSESKTIAIPLIILLITALIIPSVFSYFNRKVKINTNKITSLQKAKTAYLAVLFLWLAIFSVIPVVHSFFSVKHFEEKLWQQQQLFKMASDNLSLIDSNIDYNSHWFKLLQGNGMDNMTVSIKPFVKVNGSDSSDSGDSLSTSERIYASLPDPISDDYGHKELLSGINQKTEWILTDSSLHYSNGGQKGAVLVKAGKKSNAFTPQFFLMAMVFLLAALCIWQLVKFGATVFLNLNNEWPNIININWLDVFMNSANKRILLNSFNGELFLAETVKSLKNKKIDQKMIETIHAVQICNSGFDCKTYLEDSGKIIWISGLKECFPAIENHKLLLDSLSLMNRDSNKKIVVDLPFEIELIDEFYDDFIASNELTTKEKTDIFILRKRWNNIFENYTRYNGYLSQIESEEVETKLSEKHIKQYHQNINRDWSHSNIWKNLTIYEKIVLYDLADDGLMNRNNLKIIGQLADKKLILMKPLPIIFDRGFREYIYQHISKSEIKKIETKLGLTGNWKNAKYLILLILIPLAAFIFISQGFTIEKSFGIFAGIVGAITTLMKLFETSSIKK